MSTSVITLIADPKVLAIPVKENNEPLIDLKDQNEIVLGPSPEVPNNTDYTKLRKGVYKRLLEAQRALPKGIRFCLYEGHRSIFLQQKLFDERYRRIQKAHKTWSHKSIFEETTRLVSPVKNLDGSDNIPPHSTGGALDVYLIDADGHPIDMGIHPADWMGDQDGLLSQTDSIAISVEAQKNRKVMNKALLESGFVNYPTEYWHWSYGDRYWAFQKGLDAAIYGSYSAS